MLKPSQWFATLTSDKGAYLRVLRMRRVVRILRLLRYQCWVELLVSVDVARVDVLSWLAVGSLSHSQYSAIGLN